LCDSRDVSVFSFVAGKFEGYRENKVETFIKTMSLLCYPVEIEAIYLNEHIKGFFNN